MLKIWKKLFGQAVRPRPTTVRNTNRARLGLDTFESRVVPAVQALDITAITSVADVDNGEGGAEHVTVKPGSTVTVTFNYSTDLANATTAKLGVNTNPNTISTNEVTIVSGANKIESLSIVIPAGTAAGKYNAQIQLKNGTGKNSTDNEIDFNAVQVAITVTPDVSIIAADTIYTGATYAGTVSTSVLDGSKDVSAFGSVTTKLYSDAAATNEIAAPTNAGTYYTKAFFTTDGLIHGDKIYTNASSPVANFSIAKAGSTVTVADPDAAGGITYDGAAHGATASVAGPAGSASPWR